MSDMESTVTNDREEATDARNAVDGGYWKRIAGAVVEDRDVPDLVDVEGL